MQISQYRKTRIEKLQQIKELGINIWPSKANIECSINEIIKQYTEFDREELERSVKLVSVMGRITTMREMGKSVFIHLLENGEKIQSYFRANELDKQDWDMIKLLDIGDFIATTGILMRTKTGELTIRAKKIQFLSKAYLPLPDKWHGLQDKELRYRQRYLDLIANPNIINLFRTRSNIIANIRSYMNKLDFLEVETPIMQPIPGGASAKPFITNYHAMHMPLYLRISPELYLKRLIIGGFNKIFEINKSFRNEGISSKHNPEFTMMECYVAGNDLRDMMLLTENLFNYIASSCDSIKRPWGDNSTNNNIQTISYELPFRRLTMKDAISIYGNINREELNNKCNVLQIAIRSNIENANNKTTGILLGDLFKKYAESKLIQPTFITEYPVELSPLTKELNDNKEFTDRFELFIGGMELANAYSELNNPTTQLERFIQQMNDRNLPDNYNINPIDYDFIQSLEHGLPPTGGLGIGIDRMIMLMTNSTNIRDVILFPLMRPIEQQIIN